MPIRDTSRSPRRDSARRPAPIRGWFAAVLMVAAVPCLAPAQTQTATWTGATGNWDSPAIWTTSPQAGFFPNNGNPAGTIYNVQVSGGGTITLDVPIVIDQLTF